MPYKMNILTDKSERALMRTLGVIERRGFIVESLNLPFTAGAEQRLTIRVAARDGHRSIEVLARQIERLENVRAIEIYALSQVDRTPAMAPETPIMIAPASMPGASPVIEDVVQ